MLNSLVIHDLAIIEDTTLELSKGLNVLTGETGAGKSIIIAALGLVLGDRADLALVRRGRKQAEVEAVFSLEKGAITREKLRQFDLEPRQGDDPDLLIIRRVLMANGKGRAYVNGRTVTVSTLRAVSEGLVDISSQHQHTQLLNPQSHLDILDRFGALQATKATFHEAYLRYAEAREARAALQKKEEIKRQREDFVRFQLEELQGLSLTPGEDDLLEAEYARLGHAERILKGVQESLGHLSGGRDAVASRLLEAARVLGGLLDYEPALALQHKRLEELQIEAEDIAFELSQVGGTVDLDNHRLDEVASRLQVLSRIKKKYGGTLEEVLKVQAGLESELLAFDSLELDIKEAERAEQAVYEEAVALAEGLSKGRLDAVARLEASVQAELADLAMAEAALRVEITPKALGPEGLETVELHIQTNKGEGFAPLHRSASGGELARVLLAMKKALLHVDPVATCIFDEVDTGTGGATGDLIGRMLEAIAEERQVLCITHLPQIAARGEHHLRVTKETQGDRTATQVMRLSEEARMEELARMLGGVELTSTVKKHAEELLQRSM